MKQIQTRYLTSAIFSSIFFVICYGILNFNIIIAILLTIVIYIGGIFVFKKNDIRELNTENVNNYYFLASKVKSIASSIASEDIKNSVNEITSLTDKIIISLSQRPKKVEQVFDFFDYYLDVSYKMIYKYNLIINKENKTKDDIKYNENVPGYLKQVAELFSKQLKNMQEAKLIDVDTEIKIFEKSVGMSKDEISGGVSDGK